MDFSETIEVKVFDKAEQYSVDSYFFAYFHDLPAALEQIRDAVRAYRSIPGCSSPPSVLDTTATRTPLSPPPSQTLLPPGDRSQSMPLPEQPQKQTSPSGFRFTSLLRPLQDIPLSKAFQILEPDIGEDYTYISKRSGSSFVPVTATPSPRSPRSPRSRSRSPLPSEPTSAELTPVASNINHTYPPSTSSSLLGPQLTSSPTRDSSSTGTWSVGVPSWLKMPSRRLLTSPFSSVIARTPVEHSASMPATSSNAGISEVFSSGPALSASRTGGDFGFFSILEAPESMVDQETIDKFRSSFAFDDKEKLLGCKLSSYLLLNATVTTAC